MGSMTARIWHPESVSSPCLERGRCAVRPDQPGLGHAHPLPPLLLWQACASSHSLCSNLSSTWSLSEFPSPPGGPEATGEAGGSEPHTSVRCHLPQTQGTLGLPYVVPTHSVSTFPATAFHRQGQQGPGRLRTFFSTFVCSYVQVFLHVHVCARTRVYACGDQTEVSLGCRFFFPPQEPFT